MKLFNDIRERLEKATPGPWRYLEEYLSYGPSFVRSGRVIGTVQVFSTPIIEDGDADFIANAPTDIAKLLRALDLAVGTLKSYSGMPMRTTDGTKFSYDSDSFENDRGNQAREALAQIKELSEEGK